MDKQYPFMDKQYPRRTSAAHPGSILSGVVLSVLLGSSEFTGASLMAETGFPKTVSTSTTQLSAAAGINVADRTVRGTVKDETGAGLPGVSILVKGTQKGTSTDENGNFSLILGDEPSVLVFSFVGYATQEVTVGNQNDLNITLAVDTKSLEELVVVGYG